MKTFLTSNKTAYRLGRTILQGIVGVLIANVDLIVSSWSFSPELKPFIAALVMAILSPIMSELGASAEAKETAAEYTEEV